MVIESDIHGHITLSECQKIQGKWEKDCKLERTPFNRVLRKTEEDVELLKACFALLQEDTPENREAVAYEAADVLIITLSIIDTLGFDSERMFEEIMETNYQKYNPLKMQELIDQGLEPLEAMKELKEEWNNGLD